MPSAYPLPPELLIEIFKLSTDNGPGVRRMDDLAGMKPFEALYASQALKENNEALRTKYALSLVSKSFRGLSLEFLYEDIWIRYGSEILADVLERSAAERRGLNEFVKRVTIVPQKDKFVGKGYASSASPSRRILQSCPNVRMVSGPSDYVNDEDSAASLSILDENFDGIDLANLQRVDWSNYCAAVPIVGSQMSLPIPRFIFNSSSIHSLRLDSDIFPTLPEAYMTVLSLPSLTTLSLRSLSTFSIASSGDPLTPHLRLHFPSLRRVILQLPEAYYNLFDGALLPLASQITTLEFGVDTYFLRHDFLAAALVLCPNVREVYVPVFTTCAPRLRSSNDAPTFESVRVLYLHAGCSLLRSGGDGNCGTEDSEDGGIPSNVYDPCDLNSRWAHLELFVHGLVGEETRYQALQRIVLVGEEWRSYLDDERFVPLANLAHENAIMTEVEDAEARASFRKRVFV